MIIVWSWYALRKCTEIVMYYPNDWAWYLYVQNPFFRGILQEEFNIGCISEVILQYLVAHGTSLLSNSLPGGRAHGSQCTWLLARIEAHFSTSYQVLVYLYWSTPRTPSSASHDLEPIEPHFETLSGVILNLLTRSYSTISFFWILHVWEKCSLPYGALYAGSLVQASWKPFRWYWKLLPPREFCISLFLLSRWTGPPFDTADVPLQTLFKVCKKSCSLLSKLLWLSHKNFSKRILPREKSVRSLNRQEQDNLESQLQDHNRRSIKLSGS